MLIEILSRTDVLMNDNALLQRQIYKYEKETKEINVCMK